MDTANLETQMHISGMLLSFLTIFIGGTDSPLTVFSKIQNCPSSGPEIIQSPSTHNLGGLKQKNPQKFKISKTRGQKRMSNLHEQCMDRH